MRANWLSRRIINRMRVNGHRLSVSVGWRIIRYHSNDDDDDDVAFTRWTDCTPVAVPT